MRIYELAKQIEKDNAEIVALLKENGIEVSYAYSGSTIEVGSFSATILEDGKTLNLTIVYEPNVYVNDDEKTEYDDRLTNFDLNDKFSELTDSVLK